MGVAICGMADGREIPEGYELWGMPWDAEWTRMDVLFDMHHPSLMTKQNVSRVKDVYQPLYMQEHFYSHSLSYPLNSVIELGRDYFKCSIAYMLGLAILKRVKDIVIVGVTGSEDYSIQRPCIEYWIGVAKGMGLKVSVQGDTELFTGDRYGYI